MSADAATLPFHPRSLTRSERRSGDLYMFVSPKLGRRVELVGCLTTAIALRLEFDPLILHYVERPRILLVGDLRIELTYWTREVRDRERFWILVPSEETREPQSPRREHREARALIEAANAAHLSLEFVFEAELRQQSETLSTYYRLLPYVQTAVSLPSRIALRKEIRVLFCNLTQATYDQIERNLRGFHPADVRAVVCDLIHAGELALADTARLSRTSVVKGKTHANS